MGETETVNNIGQNRACPKFKYSEILRRRRIRKNELFASRTLKTKNFGQLYFGHFNFGQNLSAISPKWLVLS